MLNEEVERQAIIGFLQWSDGDGCYTDEQCEIEGIKPLTLEDARTHFYRALYMEDYCFEELDESFEYEFTAEVISKFQTKNGENALDFANSLINKLVSCKGNKEKVYKEIIKAI